MVDAVKMTLGTSSTAKAQRVAQHSYGGLNVPLSAPTAKAPPEQPVVGYQKSTPTGKVPETTSVQHDYVQPVVATKWESAGAAMGGVGIDMGRALYSELSFDYDPQFKHRELSDEFFVQEGVGTPREIKYLADSKSYEDWQYRKKNVLDNRLRAMASADNPLTSAAVSVIDADLALAFTPTGAGAKLATTTARLTTRGVVGATAYGAVGAAQYAQGENTLRTETQQAVDRAIFGVAGALVPLEKGFVAAKGGTPTPPVPVQQVTPSPPNMNYLGTPPRSTVPQQTAGAPTATQIQAARTVGLTDAEISALPKNQRGAARQLRHQQRLQAQQVLLTGVPVPHVSQTFVPAPNGTIQAVNPPSITPTGNNTAAQQLAQDIRDGLNAPQPTGTPAQQIKGHRIVAALQSTADYLHYLTGGDTATVVNRLLSNPARGAGDDAVSAQNVYLNNYQHRLLGFADTLKDAVRETGMRSTPWSRLNGEYAARVNDVAGDFQVAMQRLDSAVLAHHKLHGALPDEATMDVWIAQLAQRPKMQQLMREYIDSGFATKVYDDAYSSGAFTREVVDAAGNKSMVNILDDVVRRPTYMNLRHDYEKMFNTVKSGKATWDEMADFVGAQIVRMYPDLLTPKNASGTFVLTERQVGQHFIQTQKAPTRGLSDITSVGMNREQITDLLTKTGSFSDKDARILADDIFTEMHKKGSSTPQNLRRRIDWDWDATLRTQSGQELSMRDFVNDSVLGNLEDYSRGMAHKIGLANYGIKSESELDNLLAHYLDHLPKGVNVQDARQFMENTKDVLMGRPVESNPVPSGIRMAQSVADLFLLAQSGLYSLVDVATQMQKVGVLRNMAGFKQGMKALFGTLRKFHHKEGMELEDILTGRLLANSAHKNFTVRYMDNFALNSGLEEAASYYGQTARFLNLSESVKRFQVGTLSSVYVNNLHKAMKGSAKELDFLRSELKLSDALIKEVQEQYSKHGAKIDDWDNAVRISYEQKLFHSADNLAMTIHRGEIPAFMEHSAVGRIVFPYMRFAFAMQNKVLRRTLHRDGNVGLAMLMAVQIPTGMLIAASSNIRRGEPWDKDLHLVTIRSISAMGSLNYPLEMAFAGIESGGVTAMAPFAKSGKFVGQLVDGAQGGDVSASKLIQNSPLNAAIVLDYLAIAVDELNE